MIEPNTATNVVYTIYPIYSLIFLFLIGFVYHLIRNNEYKNTLLASIIIGFITGLIFNSTNLLEWIERILISIILVIIGGLMAVCLKKLLINE